MEQWLASGPRDPSRSALVVLVFVGAVGVSERASTSGQLGQEEAVATQHVEVLWVRGLRRTTSSSRIGWPWARSWSRATFIYRVVNNVFGALGPDFRVCPARPLASASVTNATSRSRSNTEIDITDPACRQARLPGGTWAPLGQAAEEADFVMRTGTPPLGRTAARPVGRAVRRRGSRRVRRRTWARRTWSSWVANANPRQRR